MSIIKKVSAALFLIWGLFVFITAMILVLPFILLSSVIFQGKRRQDIAFFFLKIWGWIFSILCFYPVRVKNRKIINPDKAYIYVSNHNSYLDAIAVVIAIPGSFKPLGKIEMAKMPIFGLIYRRVVVMIDRKSKESRAKSLEDLKYYLSKGRSILIFPEGTMNNSSYPLAEFYDGAFKLAIETQTPIAPMIILNARDLLPRISPLSAKPGLIKCVFDTPVEVSGLGSEDVDSLKAKVYNRMESLIQKHSG